MDAQKLQDPEKVSTILVKNLNKVVNILLMICMKPKDAIKLGTVPLDNTSRRNHTTRGWIV